MKELLVDPSVVLAVGGSPSSLDAIGDQLGDTGASDVAAVETLDDAVETLSTRDDVGCALLLDVGEDALAAAPDRLRSVTPHLPVVVHVENPSERALARLASSPDCRYLPQSADGDALRAAVDDALATFDRHRNALADHRLFQLLLAESDITLFAKDDRARYVRTTGPLETDDESDILGKTDREIFGARNPRTAESTYRDDLQVVETGEAIRGQRERFGSQYWSESTKFPVRGEDGDPIGLVGYALDVTHEVELEHRLAEQTRRFDKFASYVSHDLRTPLQVAFGALERARNGDEAALDKLEESHERIEEIIEDLRALTEEDASAEASDRFGSVDSTTASTDLPRLIDQVWRMTAPTSATLDLDLPDGTLVAADREVVRPLVENLLKNAVDHAGPAVTVTVGLTDGRGFYVADDGPGIPPDERDDVLEQGYTTSDQGTGTGLAIVNETVIQRNWDLAISESATGGARFEITNCPVVVPRAATATTPLSLDESFDVGAVDVAGHSEYDPNSDSWTVAGGGADVWGNLEEFHFVSTTTDGPVRIEGRVDDLQGDHEYAKAGLMVRDDSAVGAPFVYVGRSVDHGTEVIWRRNQGAPVASEQYEEPAGTYPWYRLDRFDDRVVCSLSPDGEAWEPVDERPADIADPVDVGLAVCSHEPGQLATADFSSVAVHRLDVTDSME